MKVLIDENLPPALARSLNELFAGKHEIIHTRERYGPGVKDLQWIRELSAEGRWIIISGDRRITRNNARERISLGSYKTPEEANAAYFGAARVLFGEFARSR